MIIHKFNPNLLIILKTILSANNYFINRKLGALNHSLFRLVNTFYHKNSSPNLNVNFSANMFCKVGIHFSFNGNKIFSLLLAQLTCVYSPKFTLLAAKLWPIKRTAMFANVISEKEANGVSFAKHRSMSQVAGYRAANFITMGSPANNAPPRF